MGKLGWIILLVLFIILVEGGGEDIIHNIWRDLLSPLKGEYRTNYQRYLDSKKNKKV